MTRWIARLRTLLATTTFLTPLPVLARQEPVQPPPVVPPTVPSTPNPGGEPAVPIETPPAPTPDRTHQDEGAPAPNFDAPPGMQRPARGPLEQRRGAPGERPLTPEQRNRVTVENADEVREREADGIVIATGNVRVLYAGYLLTSDRASLDRRQRIVTFESNVTLQTERQTVFADFIRVDTRTADFTARGGRTILPPDQIGQQILQPVYLSGETLSRKDGIYQATRGFFTTCDFPFPHYRIGFRQADLIPNNRMVFRDAVVYRYDEPVARIPYLVIPVREQTNLSYLPYIGRNNEEGYFIKAVVGYALSSTLPGLLRVDMMEKKGVGLGFDQAYRVSNAAAGSVSLYNLNDRNRGTNNTNGRINHQQRIGEILATINSDFQTNSYNALLANSRTQLTTITANRSIGPSSTSLSLNLNTSGSPGTASRNIAYTLTQTQRIGQGGESGSITFRFNGSDNSSETTTGAGTDVAETRASGRIEQVGDLRATGRVGAFDLELAANRTFASHLTGQGNGGNFFSGTERLPDFTIGTDSRRLGGILRAFPSRFLLGFGQFIENPGRVTTRRLLFNLDPDQRVVNLTRGGALALTLDGDFRQTYYRDDAAQYILSTRSQITQKLSSASSLNLTYGYLRPYGGTPPDFRLDQTGSNNNLGANVTVNSERVRLSLITGYDIQRAKSDLGLGVPKNPWQNLSAQLSLKPSGVFQTRFTSSYDINSGRLIDATNRIRLRGRNGFALDTGLRYDPRQRKFPQITEALQMPLFSRDLRLTALAGYNGVTKRFDYKNFGLVLGFHDYEYAFSYQDQPYGFRTERGFNVTIRLRALPASPQQRTGQFGTALDTGTGEVF